MKNEENNKKKVYDEDLYYPDRPYTRNILGGRVYKDTVVEENKAQDLVIIIIVFLIMCLIASVVQGSFKMV